MRGPRAAGLGRNRWFNKPNSASPLVKAMLSHLARIGLFRQLVAGSSTTNSSRWLCSHR